MIGYIANILILYSNIIDIIFIIVAIEYFFGGFFVCLIILRSFETYKQLDNLFKQQEDHIDQILKISQFKTDFMMTMSHELRTPLNSIIGFTDLILEGTYGHLSEDQKNFITDIKSSAEYQFDMIKNILEISNIESGKLSLKIQEFSVISLLNQIKITL
jgi:signal transduction histidine kinase